MYMHTDSPSVFVLQIYPTWRIHLSESESSITTPGVKKINTFVRTSLKKKKAKSLKTISQLNKSKNYIYLFFLLKSRLI